MIALPDVIPTSWKLGALIALAGALSVGGVAYHHHVYQSGYDDAVTARAAADSIAVIHRGTENTALAIKQSAVNTLIEKATHEELAPVVQRIVADRVRVGPAICNGSATPAKAESAGSGDAANPPGRLVRGDLERDIRALEIRVEEALATGRACQAFVIANGLAP
jgi:hypothetical protein